MIKPHLSTRAVFLCGCLHCCKVHVHATGSQCVWQLVTAEMHLMLGYNGTSHLTLDARRFDRCWHADSARHAVQSTQAIGTSDMALLVPCAAIRPSEGEPSWSVLIRCAPPATINCTTSSAQRFATANHQDQTGQDKTYSTLQHFTLSRLVPHQIRIRPKQRKEARYAATLRPSICYYATASLSTFAQFLLLLLSSLDYLALNIPTAQTFISLPKV